MHHFAQKTLANISTTRQEVIGWKITPRMTNMMIVDTITAETIKIIEDKILKNVTESAQNAGHAYQIHNLEFIQITENVTDMTKIAHHCDEVKEVDASMKGSENQIHENHKYSIYRAKKAKIMEGLRMEDLDSQV